MEITDVGGRLLQRGDEGRVRLSGQLLHLFARKLQRLRRGAVKLSGVGADGPVAAAAHRFQNLRHGGLHLAAGLAVSLLQQPDIFTGGRAALRNQLNHGLFPLFRAPSER